MNVAAQTKLLRIAVLGNPNTGKSTLFNALTGASQRTANFPGVTVERRTGRMIEGGTQFELIDLPGTYSLAPHSPDEMVTVQVLLGQYPHESSPDLILCVVDASNLERNLYLVSQLLDLRLPLVIALNMVDLAEKKGWRIDVERLQALLGVPVVPIQAHKRLGLDVLRKRILEVVNRPPSVPHEPFSSPVRDRIARLDEACPDDCPLKRFVVTRLLFDTDGMMTRRLQPLVGPAVIERLPAERQALADSTGISLAEQESQGRYTWIKAHSEEFLRRRVPSSLSWTVQLDRWLTHPWCGMAVVAMVLFCLFQVVYQVAEPASQAIDGLKSLAASGVEYFLAEGALRSLLVDGLINGVGSVLVFLPQIMLLFFILGWLEDSGYLARASYLADRLLSRIGLSGTSVIPLLSSFACAIPGIMATRVISHRPDRMITILIAPLMSCSARLPVYVLLIGAFVPDQRLVAGWLSLRGLCMMGMYLVGTATAIAVAWILKRVVFPSSASSFIIELPTYKWPQWSVILRRMWEGGKSFVRGAGTTIVAVSIIVWAAAYFPRSPALLPVELRQAIEASAAQLAEDIDDAKLRASLEEQHRLLLNRADAAYLEASYLGRFGKWIEPAVRPLGWDWRIGSAVVASFPAREVVVSTMGIVFGLGRDVDEESSSLRESIIAARWSDDGRPLFTLPVALGLMVFFALCAQCASTLVVIKRETGSWWWPAVTFLYMTTLAYFAAWLTVLVTSAWWE